MATDWLQGQVQRLLQEAAEALTAADWVTVKQRALSILALDPANNDAQGLLDASERSIDASASDLSTANTAAQVAPQSSDDQPTSFADGRYVVQRFLGEGGKKKVYLAHDELLDRDVAFALIKTEGLDEVSRTRITREAQAMGRLGSHPHIVTVFDLGEVDSSDKDPVSGATIKQPFMVAELMGGGDVEGIVEDAPDHKLPLEQAINIAVETCRGLDFAHSKGIVHRDLKPGNVWLTSDGVAKIGDFGLAVAIDRSRLTQAGMMVGTVSYMPPEQAMGGETTPKADLYSLGAMLYEMVTGRPPFLGDDSVAIIGQHINTPPVAPTWHRSDCPRPLEALIMRLLAKDPNERPESAADVLTALEAIDLTPLSPTLARGDGRGVHGAGGEGTVEEANVLDSLAGGVFVGRQAEMGQLKAALEDTLSGRGRMVMLVGEPGIGKTRTAQEVATYAGLRGCQVLWGRCYESEGAPSFCPWIQALRSYVVGHDRETLRLELGTGAVDLVGIIPEISEKLPGLPTPPPLPPEQARFRLFESITSFLRTASQRQPLVVILDNLHWSDQPTLRLMEYLAPELERMRVLILATYRDAELGRRHPLSQTIAELGKEKLFQRVFLRGLNRDEAARLIEVSVGVEPPPGLVDAVHAQTEGNPLFMGEVIRLLVQEGQLGTEKSDGQGAPSSSESWSVRIPEGVRAVVGRRLDSLPDACNEALTIAAVLGREFSLEQLERLTDDLTSDELLDLLEVALATRVIEELPGSPGHYQFTSSLIQHTLADELSTTRRVRLHARIADVLEKLWDAQAEAHAAELAHHFGEASAFIGHEKLVRYALIAGEHALEAFAFEDALGFFQRALESKSEGELSPEAASLFFGLGRAQAALLKMGGARSSLTRAFDYYVELGNIDGAVEAAVHPVGFANTGIPDLVNRALELVAPDSHDEGRLLSQHGFNRGEHSDDYKGAQNDLARALSIAEREEDVSLQMWTLARSGHIGMTYLRSQECVVKNGQVVELTPQADDPNAEGFARACLAQTLVTRGAPEEAWIQTQAILTLAERTRYRSGLVLAHALSVVPPLLKGDWGSARELSDRGLAMAPRFWRLIYPRVLVEYETGEFDQGETFMERLLDITRSTSPSSGSLMGMSFPAITIALVGRITGVDDWLDDAEKAARTVLSSSPTPRPSMAARLAMGLVASQRGDLVEAGEQYAAIEPLRASYPEDCFVCMSVDRLLALLSVSLNRPDQAVAHFEDALTFCRRAGYRPELAWSLCDYADMLLERKSEGDSEKAVAMLDESLAISTELGMRPLMERVLSRRDILKA